MSCVVCCPSVFRRSPFASTRSLHRSHSLVAGVDDICKPSSSSLVLYSLSSTICTLQLRLLLTSFQRRTGICALPSVASSLLRADKRPEEIQKKKESGTLHHCREPFDGHENHVFWRIVDSSVHQFLELRQLQAETTPRHSSSARSIGLRFTSILISFWNFVIATDVRLSQRRVGHGVLSLLLALALTSNNGSLSSMDTFENVPQSLSGADKAHRIQRPKSAKAESCTRKCVSTCIRGGAGAPGEGPLNVRRPLVVFKEGFRSRQYCLVECSEICNLIGDGDDGP